MYTSTIWPDSSIYTTLVWFFNFHCTMAWLLHHTMAWLFYISLPHNGLTFLSLLHSGLAFKSSPCNVLMSMNVMILKIRMPYVQIILGKFWLRTNCGVCQMMSTRWAQDYHVALILAYLPKPSVFTLLFFPAPSPSFFLIFTLSVDLKKRSPKNGRIVKLSLTQNSTGERGIVGQVNIKCFSNLEQK